MARLFGTDGVRGIANRGLDCNLAFKLGQATATVLAGAVNKPRILIGRDPRISGDMLECALVAGITSAGAHAVILRVIPTSAVAHLTRVYEADAGIVISASHNSYEYNGIKIFNRYGFKLADEIEDDIEKMVRGEELADLPIAEEIGGSVRIKSAAAEYIDFVAGTCDASLDGLKIVLDCANGAASFVAPRIFEKLGAKVHAIHDSPNGTNINNMCGSTHPKNLTRAVQEIGADFGLAFDGDADRLIAVDEHGSIVDGDRIMAINAVDMKQRGVLNKNTLVATVMSNLGLELGLKKQGIDIVKTDVGDRYVLERMKADGYNLGGEQSGHVIFLDHSTTGDGILTGVALAAVVKQKERRLSQLAKVVSILPQVLVNAKVAEEKKFDYLKDDDIKSEIAKLEDIFAGEGRVLIRTSGTEPLVRVMIEGKDRATIEVEALRIAKLIEKRLG